MHRRITIALCTLMTTPALAQWSNSGGDYLRSSRAEGYGPDRAERRWSVWMPTREAAQPLAYWGIVVAARSTVPPEEEEGRPVIFAFSTNDGSPAWSASIPFEAGQGSASVLAIWSEGVYVSRATPDSAARIYRLDLDTGAILWTSSVAVRLDPRGGVIRTLDGLVTGGPTELVRFDPGLRWSAPRQVTVGGHPGATGTLSTPNRLYIIDDAAGGQVIRRINPATGAAMYESPPMPTGTSRYPIVVARQSNDLILPVSSDDPARSFAYAFTDTGTGLLRRWSAPIGYSIGGESAVLSDGSLIVIGPGNRLQRLSILDGSVMAEGPMITESPLRPTWVVDGRNVIYMSTGTGPSGRLYAFDSGLNEYFPPVSHPGIGGIAMFDRTLIVADRAGLFAYWTDSPIPPGCPQCTPDYDQSGGMDGDDLTAFFDEWKQGLPCADVDRSGGIDMDDAAHFLLYWQTGSCI